MFNEILHCESKYKTFVLSAIILLMCINWFALCVFVTFVFVYGIQVKTDESWDRERNAGILTKLWKYFLLVNDCVLKINIGYSSSFWFGFPFSHNKQERKKNKLTVTVQMTKTQRSLTTSHYYVCYASCCNSSTKNWTFIAFASSFNVIVHLITAAFYNEFIKFLLFITVIHFFLCFYAQISMLNSEII